MWLGEWVKARDIFLVSLLSLEMIYDNMTQICKQTLNHYSVHVVLHVQRLCSKKILKGKIALGT